MKFYDAEANAVVELRSTDGARTLCVSYPHREFDLRDIEFIFCDNLLTVSGYIYANISPFYEHVSFDLRPYSKKKKK